MSAADFAAAAAEESYSEGIIDHLRAVQGTKVAALIREQLARTLGAGGFDPARDIAAITVNRWPHGYSYDANTLFDPEAAGPPPYEIGRKRSGRVAIANSDAGWNAYTHEAIDQAWRAVEELKSA